MFLSLLSPLYHPVIRDRQCYLQILYALDNFDSVYASVLLYHCQLVQLAAYEK